MNYRLRTNQPPGDEVRRVAGALTREIRRNIRARPEPTGEAIHQARKNIKKLRSMLRLVRPQTGDAIFQRENRALRRIGRLLSPARDSQVCLKTLRRIGTPTRENASRHIAARLALQHRRTLEQIHSGRAIRTVTAPLRTVEARIPSWTVDRAQWRDLTRELRRACRRARQAFKLAIGKGTPPRLHEWRKRAKDLWYGVRLLQGLRPRAMRGLADRLKKVTEHLGLIMDLAVLRKAIRGMRFRAELPRGIRSLLETIHREEARREKKARRLGAGFFATKPEKFLRSLRAPA